MSADPVTLHRALDNCTQDPETWTVLLQDEALAMAAEIERLNAYIEDILLKDRLKTREINILTLENRTLLGEIERLRRALIAAETALGLHRDVSENSTGEEHGNKS